MGVEHPLYCDSARENQEDLKEKTLNLSVAMGIASFFTLCGGIAWIGKKEQTE